MIEVVEGNLLKAKENIIIHQVNCMGIMGSGVALQIKKKWPVVYEEYSKFCRNQNRLLGEAQLVQVKDNQYIANIFGQFDYGMGKRQTNYEAIYTALERVAKSAKSQGLSVALPYNMGCDRGGGDWRIISTILRVLFEDLEVKIYKLEEK